MTSRASGRARSPTGVPASGLLAVRDRLAAFLRGHPLIADAIVGEAGDGAAAISMTRALRPGVVLMDVRMPT